MTTAPVPRRFASPEFVQDMGELIRRSRRNLGLGVALALLLHVGLIGVNPFKRPPEEAARPVATRFLKREPNLTKPLELRK
ncbi:MAG: hypothetical protein AB1505_36185, partial [Candidatus Latescibacterota bacterium]